MSYFKPKEFDCQCGCGAMPQAETIALAERVRSEWGKPLNCVSGARCMGHTLALRLKGIPAALGSEHLKGLAIDLAPADMRDIKAFQDFCIKHLEPWGVCMEDPFSTAMWVHLDFKKRPLRIFKP